MKILLVGNIGVGKTSTLYRCMDNTYTENIVPTMGPDFRIKNITVEGRDIKVALYDTAGSEKFKAITRMYYRGTHGVILLYDISDRSTFESIKN